MIHEFTRIITNTFDFVLFVKTEHCDRMCSWRNEPSCLKEFTLP